MNKKILAGVFVSCSFLVAQQPAEPSGAAEHVTGNTEPSSSAVTADPNQPYRPVPANPVRTRESIFEFYLRALNPHQIRWGDEIKRRIAVLIEHSVNNPYFLLCALDTGLIVFLLLVCWVWWDKTRQIKWTAAECLTEAINAKRVADQRAFAAIDRYNRHMEMCNRVIEGQESGLATDSSAETWQRELRELQAKFEAEQKQSARLSAELEKREEFQTQLQKRIAELEGKMADRQQAGNAELLARLQRAEAELANRKPVRR